MNPLLCLKVIGSQGSFCFVEYFAGVAPLLRVGIRLRQDHRTARKPPKNLYLEQRWGLGGQLGHELDVARCLQNNGLRRSRSAALPIWS